MPDAHRALHDAVDHLVSGSFDVPRARRAVRRARRRTRAVAAAGVAAVVVAVTFLPGAITARDQVHFADAPRPDQLPDDQPRTDQLPDDPQFDALARSMFLPVSGEDFRAAEPVRRAAWDAYLTQMETCLSGRGVSLSVRDGQPPDYTYALPMLFEDLNSVGRYGYRVRGRWLEWDSQAQRLLDWQRGGPLPDGFTVERAEATLTAYNDCDIALPRVFPFDELDRDPHRGRSVDDAGRGGGLDPYGDELPAPPSAGESLGLEWDSAARAVGGPPIAAAQTRNVECLRQRGYDIQSGVMADGLVRLSDGEPSAQDLRDYAECRTIIEQARRELLGPVREEFLADHAGEWAAARAELAAALAELGISP